MSKASRNRQAAREKIAQLRAEEARRNGRRTLILGIGAVAVVIAVAVGIAVALSSGGGGKASPVVSHSSSPRLRLAPLSTLGTLATPPASGSLGFEGILIPDASPLAGIRSAATGAQVDGIKCDTNEQSLFHIHAHLTIFVNGSPRQVPAGIGIPGAQFQQTSQGPAVGSGTCFYWLHTHAADGIIHIESPVQRTFTLGDLFDEWGQPLGPNRLGPQTGRVVAIYNEKAYLGNPRDIPLNAHAQIQLEVGTPLVAPERVSFPGGL